jgi:hypothetical protein
MASTMSLSVTEKLMFSCVYVHVCMHAHESTELNIKVDQSSKRVMVIIHFQITFIFDFVAAVYGYRDMMILKMLLSSISSIKLVQLNVFSSSCLPAVLTAV